MPTVKLVCQTYIILQVRESSEAVSSRPIMTSQVAVLDELANACSLLLLTATLKTYLHRRSTSEPSS